MGLFSEVLFVHSFMFVYVTEKSASEILHVLKFAIGIHDSFWGVFDVLLAFRNVLSEEVAGFQVLFFGDCLDF